MLSESNIEAITAGLDWITLTLPADKATAGIWIEHCLHVLDDIAKEGYELKYRTIQGYYGVSCGNNFVGSRDDGHMVQLTGHSANEHYIRVYRPDAHISRVDVQCTVKYKEMPNDIARNIAESTAHSNQFLSRARHRKTILITGSDGGDTLYIGSPSSEQRARIYNKDVQSEDIAFMRCWRFEIVYKNDLATRLCISTPLQAIERAEWAKSVVYAWLAARGTCMLWGRECAAITLPLARMLPTDVERRIGWLRKQVAPTIRKLIQANHTTEVLEILDEAGVSLSMLSEYLGVAK